MRIFLSIGCLFGALWAGAEENFDVVVYGGTAGGAITAIAAAEEGATVVLIEPGAHIGGLVSGGLGRTDIGNQAVIGGMSRAYFKRVGAHYGKELEWYVEPHVAEEIFRAWLAEANVALRFGQRVDSVAMENETIASITMESGETYLGKIFVDASYEGDVMARAGITYTYGREGREVYGESLAGVINHSPKHQFAVPISPYDDEGNLLPLIYGGDPGQPGEGDKKVQAYNFRLCMTQVQDNLVPFPKPEGYDPKEFELLRRYLNAVPNLTVEDIMNPRDVNNGKTDTNNDGPVSTDVIGESWDYPEASYAERERIKKRHEQYTKGFFYFIANDPSVPKALQDELNTWGLAKDEFVDNGHFPHQIYVREARRMVGAYVMTQKDLQDQRTKPDSIGMGSYNSDSHNVQRIVSDSVPGFPEGTWVINEGDMQVPVRPYEIAYGTITPKKDECANLLVVCGLSASHVAYSSIRMEPQYMIMGQAAGVAAQLAIAGNTPVQDIDIAALQAKLREGEAILTADEAVSTHSRLSAIPGIAIDNDTAEFTEGWRRSHSALPFVGFDYSHVLDDAPADAAARYVPAIPRTGKYTVRLYYSPHPNRAKNAKVVIEHAGGTAELRIDQRTLPKADTPYQVLGTFTFNAGTEGSLALINDDPQGYLIADTVAWVPTP